jgi:thioesterase domain-containing protein
VLLEGSSSVALVCIPTITVLSGIHEYRTLVAALSGRHTVCSLPIPGFFSAEPIAATVDAMVGALSLAIRELVNQFDAFVLAGHSSGGMLAYALASNLVETGRAPLGVALLDTYVPDQIMQPSPDGRIVVNDVGRSLGEQMVSTANALNLLDENRLTAAAIYTAMFADWKPAQASVPIMYAVAQDSADSGPLRDARITRWQSVCCAVDMTLTEITGNHFDVVTRSSWASGVAVEDWIDGLVAQWVSSDAEVVQS